MGEKEVNMLFLSNIAWVKFKRYNELTAALHLINIVLIKYRFYMTLICDLYVKDASILYVLIVELFQLNRITHHGLLVKRIYRECIKYI